MKHFQYLKTHSQTQAFFKQFNEALNNAASEIADHTVVFRPKKFSARTYFFDKYDFWAMLTDGKAKNRYWNCFGLGGQARNASQTIAVEINHPYQGLDRRIAGRFLVDDAGRFAIAHSGSLGGGIKGLTKKDFLEFSGRPGISVQINNKTEILAFLSYLDHGEQLLAELSNYVLLAHSYRKAKILSNREAVK